MTLPLQDYGRLGLSVEGGSDAVKPRAGLVVTAIKPDSAAEAAKRIAVGDEIIAVNGTTTLGLRHKPAVELILRGASEGRLTLSLAKAQY